MARKKKNVLQKGFEFIFGKTWNKWDVILLVLLVSAGYYIWQNQTLAEFYETIAIGVFFSLFGSLILRRLLRRASR